MRRATTVPSEDQAPPHAGVRVILLTQGWVAWVDEEDYLALVGTPWYAQKMNGGLWYARCNARPPHRPHHLMHRQILNAAPGVLVDHRDHREQIRVVDNRRRNLRLCNQSQNNQNQRPKLRPFKGIKHRRSGAPYEAAIKVHRKKIYLGVFRAEEYAALAYDYAARKLFGDFARTNYPSAEGPTWGAPDSPLPER